MGVFIIVFVVIFIIVVGFFIKKILGKKEKKNWEMEINVCNYIRVFNDV